jgi:hypothetical protein
MRSQIYLPVLRFGLTDEDWGVVILASVAGYAIPFMFGMKLAGIPLEMVGWLVAMLISVGALNILRRKSRSCWLKHTLQSRLQGRVSRRRLPGDAMSQWLKTDRGEK